VKAILEFNLPEDQEEYDKCTKASNMSLALWHTAQDVFRPARKHGYNDVAIQLLLEKLGDDGYELVSLLEQKFWDICNAQGIADKL
jgi:hypothetical protein